MTFARNISALIAIFCAGMAWACEPLPPHLVKDPRIKIASDCSFTDGTKGYIGPLTAGPAIDLGDDKIGQKLTAVYDGGLCGIVLERLLVVDCSTGDDLVFEGREKGDHAESGTEIRNIQRPAGPLSLSPGFTMADLQETAQRNDISFEVNSIHDLARKLKPRNRFDAACGCKLHYPDSLGARK